MLGRKEEYNLVCSLGGNCAASHNLLYRNLRPFALPFDWTYCNSDEAVYVLAEGFKDNFKNYMLKNNLVELEKNDAHSDRIQYFDNYGKIIWANHFSCRLDENNEYKNVKEKFDRRFKRLITKVKSSDKILFLFSFSFDVSVDSFEFLYNTLTEIYTNKLFEIKIVCFNSAKNQILKKDNIVIFKYKRAINNDDFNKTTDAWKFLNKIKLKPVENILVSD